MQLSRHIPSMWAGFTRSLSDRETRNEWSQALVRLTITVLVVLYMGFIDLYQKQLDTPSAVTQLVIAYLFYSVLVIASFGAWPRPSLLRKLITLVSDIGITLYAMHVVGEAAAPFFVIILWVTIGFGIRYGQRYLVGGTLYSSAGLLLLDQFSPYWQEHYSLTLSYLVAVLVIPFFASHLLSRIERAKYAAEAANLAKSRFLANMSHEIRTPLAAIIGIADLLLEEQLAGKQNDQINTIATSARNLLHLLDDTLDISKIEAGKLTLDLGEVDLFEMTNSLGLMFRPLVRAKGLNFSTRIQAEIPSRLQGDALRLRQILANFLSNAVKFTHQGGIELRVSLLQMEEGQATLRFEVSDTGIGIATENQERIFDLFEQADNSTTRRYGGSGLGMAISRQLAQLMGGQVGVVSAEGEGATFWLQVRMEVLSEDRGFHQVPCFSGVDALIVSANRLFVSQYRQLLERWGCGVESVPTVIDAFVQLNKGDGNFQHYQLMLLDGDTMELTPEQFARARARAPMLQGVSSLLLTTPDRVEKEEVKSCFDAVVDGSLDSTILFRSMHELLVKNHPANVPAPAVVPRVSERGGRLLRVLVVDDNQTVQFVISTMLKRAGHRVSQASDGEQALDQLFREEFDLVVIDMQMPDLSGPDVIRAYRFTEHGRGGHLPFIVLSANITRDAREEAEDAGADLFLSKPVEAEKLVQEVARLALAEKGETPAVRQETGGNIEPLPLQASASAVLDLKVIREIVAMSGDTGFLSRLLENFWADADAALVAMEKGLAAGQMDLVRDAAHGLQGSSGSIGARALYSRCREIARARNRDLHKEGGPMLELVRKELQRVRTRLDEAGDQLRGDNVHRFPGMT